MSSVLQLLLEGERLNTAQMAQVLGLSEADVAAELKRLEADEVLLGWRPVLNPERAQENFVRAVIEVRITPERDGGFDRLAARISRFDAVESCYLMSGSYDLLVIAAGRDLRAVASFVSERLASVEGVLSTATHFMLRAYKEQGHLFLSPTEGSDKPAVSA
ncbi:MULTISPECIES: Lrp/AsnC family transcriptional regulator [unclassified Lentimonas]|uniref:Lrp/AsnC family transcriptional regulator n=1 Tax=unclassified Lentimonas TaxID=2630993 RepID=UPI001320755D|nr:MULTISPECIES: Lrp/AsnC family transcriptional regulator [unclassified Lentimonas]CAA6677321.1 Transcriptional regulator, AsnC family [Lentimonas sp. CC4]CAA6686866.1 Transcriptional regulator, AsnC family [Lentimonas sp. CC6]CAA7074567.1 Transcriptional regulator, AsnC family [Lentimonas sp. CC4]CAA7169183.1 Transcriptional regulator, AsnC family [Lentimonas sp. CC21]CAA7180416.1 Transcriptional regulator, AsnC family [Lentimonas sp. CC8]